MTSERREPKREPSLRISPLELRLYVVAFLAAVYAISWRAIGGHAAPADPVAIEPPTVREPEPRVVWLDSIDPAMRPVIALPAGWHLASEPIVSTSQPTASTSQPARVVRAPTHRVRRVRTRSS